MALVTKEILIISMNSTNNPVNLDDSKQDNGVGVVVLK